MRVRRVVFDGFFKLEEATLRYERFDGTMGPEVRRLSLERGDAVAVLILLRDSQELVLVNQFKYPTLKHGTGWITELVAGMVDAGETPDEAARREVREETGFELDELVPISTFYVSPGGSSERIALYFGATTEARRSGTGGGVAGEQEDIQLVRMSPRAALAAVAAGEIRDAKTIVALYWLEQQRRARDG